MTGAWNAVAPEHITNREFMRILAKVLEKPFFFPAVPSFVIENTVWQNVRDHFKGKQGFSGKIISAGYIFEYPDLENALKNLFPKR